MRKKQDGDNLTLIRGITAKREKILKEKLDIFTFSDLSQADPDEIVPLLKQGRTSASLDEITKWQKEANQREAAKRIWLQGYAVEFSIKKDAADHDRDERMTVFDLNISPEGDWQPNGKEELLSTNEKIDLLGWMATRAGLDSFNQPSAKYPDQTELFMEEARETSDVQGEISSGPVATLMSTIRVQFLRILQPGVEAVIDPGHQSAETISSLSSQRPIRLEVDFEIPGLADLTEISPQSVSAVEFYVNQVGQPENRSLGEKEMQTLLPGKSEYTAVLEQVLLPPGQYIVGVIVNLRGIMPKADFLQSPFLQVI